MPNVWVYKADGSLQCDPKPGISPEQMRAELASLISDESILKLQKRALPVLLPTLCGSPTGQVNAYEITEEGYYLLMHGVVGPMGFALWIWSDPGTIRGAGEAENARAGDGDPFPVALLRNAKSEHARGAFTNFIASLTQAGGQPTLISELIGRRCRCYKQGDALTLDYWPDRVNIELTEHRTIARVWFG